MTTGRHFLFFAFTRHKYQANLMPNYKLCDFKQLATEDAAGVKELYTFSVE